MENLFSKQESLDKSQLLVDLFDAYYAARKNKRAKESQLAFEWEYESRLIALRDNITNRVYEPLLSIAFVNKKPVLREVFAASFQDRVMHHLIFNHINPMPGNRNNSNGTVNNEGTNGNYWGSTVSGTNAQNLNFNGSNANMNNNNRANGFTVRCLKDGRIS